MKETTEAALSPEEREELVALAIEIADDEAGYILESDLTPVSVGEDVWYDLDSLNADMKVELAGCLRYCKLRGLMQRHPEHPNLIQMLEP
jgi:hypothetical protein